MNSMDYMLVYRVEWELWYFEVFLFYFNFSLLLCRNENLVKEIDCLIRVISLDFGVKFFGFF